MTHLSISISSFQGLFRNIVFRYVALVTKKLWAILVFFCKDRTFFCPVTYPINKNKIFFSKNPLHYYSLKVTKFHSDSVKNESATTKNNKGPVRQTPPPSACLGLIIKSITLSLKVLLKLRFFY